MKAVIKHTYLVFFTSFCNRVPKETRKYKIFISYIRFHVISKSRFLSDQAYLGFLVECLINRIDDFFYWSYLHHYYVNHM